MIDRKRIALLVCAALLVCGRSTFGEVTDQAWRPAGELPISSGITPDRPDGEPTVTRASYDRSSSLSASEKPNLPSDAGQVWKEYDISAYTSRVTNTKRPEQAIIDWILRETGYEAWHGETVSVLSANSRTLRVYHTPEMQATAADMVNRFVNGDSATFSFGLRVATLDSPSWRSLALPYLRAVPVQTPGACAWLMAKENAAMLVANLKQRSDYREHSSPYLIVANGQSTVISAMRGRPYARDVLLRPDLANGYEMQPGQADEGFAIDFSPLMTADRRMIDATLKCQIDQVERMQSAFIDIPSGSATPKQRAKIEVPQMTHCNFHERFRWPTDQVLLIDLGMAALPVPVDGRATVPGTSLLGTSPARADLLIFVECRGSQSAVAAQAAPSQQQRQGVSQQQTAPLREAKTYRGRY